MSCMCGDSCCRWCGPAQGNWQCPICDSWASEGCKHLDPETGEIKTEYRQAAHESIEAKNRSWDDFYRRNPDFEVDEFLSDFQPES
jgi:hypothetical protein